MWVYVFCFFLKSLRFSQWLLSSSTSSSSTFYVISQTASFVALINKKHFVLVIECAAFDIQHLDYIQSVRYGNGLCLFVTKEWRNDEAGFRCYVQTPAINDGNKKYERKKSTLLKFEKYLKTNITKKKHPQSPRAKDIESK